MNKPYWLIGLALLAASCRSEAESPVFARADGPVLDQADILSPVSEGALGTRLREFWVEGQTAIVVATVPTLKGQTIEDAARSLFRERGIGSKEANRGVLLLIAPTERRARIEVGCGLETILTDAFAQQVMDDVLLPNFAESRFEDGVTLGVSELIHRLATTKVAPGPVTPYCVELMRKAA